MYKKAFSLLLVSFLIQMICFTPVSAVVPSDKETTRIDKIKERIGAIYLEKKRVIVTRRDGAKLQGRISEVKESSFILINERTDTTIEVKYDDATQIKTKASGLSTSTKVLIGVGIAVAAAVTLVFIIKPFGSSPFPRCTADQSNAPCDR